VYIYLRLYVHVRLRARHDDYYKRVPEGHRNCPGRESRSSVSSQALLYMLLCRYVVSKSLLCRRLSFFSQQYVIMCIVYIYTCAYKTIITLLSPPLRSMIDCNAATTISHEMPQRSTVDRVFVVLLSHDDLLARALQLSHARQRPETLFYCVQ